MAGRILTHREQRIHRLPCEQCCDGKRGVRHLRISARKKHAALSQRRYKRHRLGIEAIKPQRIDGNQENIALAQAGSCPSWRSLLRVFGGHRWDCLRLRSRRTTFDRGIAAQHLSRDPRMFLSQAAQHLRALQSQKSPSSDAQCQR